MSAWQLALEKTVPKIEDRVSVGYLIGETKEEITVAPSIADLGSEHIQARDIIRIARSAVECIAYQ